LAAAARFVSDSTLEEAGFEPLVPAQIAKAVDYIPERTETALEGWPKTAMWFGMKLVAEQSALQGRLKSTGTHPA
jgi:hypothetical protein